MTEYIEREALIKRLEVTPILKYGVPTQVRDGVIDLVEKQPAADVEPVVRCKDCKHHHWEQEPCHGRTEHLCDLLKMEVWKDFFCWYGKRK